jgi:hypothetical protein
LDRVPPAYVYSRLQRQLQQSPQLSAVFGELTRQVGQALPDFGQCLAMDGKALASYAQPPLVPGRQRLPQRAVRADGGSGPAGDSGPG